MKLLASIALLAGSSALATPNPDVLRFNSEVIGHPPLSLADVIGSATTAPKPLQFGSPSTPAPRPVAARPAPRRPAPSKMPVVEPDPNVDFKIAIARPDPNIDFKIKNPLAESEDRK